MFETSQDNLVGSTTRRLHMAPLSDPPAKPRNSYLLHDLQDPVDDELNRDS